MATTIVNYGLILSLLAIAFGVGFSVLLPEEINSNTTKLYFTKPAFIPMWSIFGDFDYETFESDLAPSTMLQAVGPSLLALSMFVLTIVVLNLMIAQMGSDFEESKASNEQEFARLFFERVSYFKDIKNAFPPPLNFIFFLWKGYDGVCAMCRTKGTTSSSQFGFSEFKWLSNCDRVSDGECAARDLYIQQQKQRRAEERTLDSVLERLVAQETEIEKLVAKQAATAPSVQTGLPPAPPAANRPAPLPPLAGGGG
eukprot:5524757-Prymnesium_polylepis.1